MMNGGVLLNGLMEEVMTEQFVDQVIAISKLSW